MKLAGVPLRQSLATYASLRPVGFGTGLRLLVAFVRSGLLALTRPSAFEAVGNLIPGISPIVVRLDHVTAEVRPGTADLGLLAAAMEPEAARWFRPRRGEVVIDVGAQIGRYTLLAAAEGARVISIEPEPSNFDLLVRNVQRNGFTSVEALPLALADHAGEATLYLPGLTDTGTPSLDPGWSHSGTHTPQRTAIQVQVDTLDHVVGSRGLDQVDWLKVDVEGTEVQVLHGAAATLPRVNRLILEVTEGHETKCRELTSAAGLSVRGREHVEGARTANWFLTRGD